LIDMPRHARPPNEDGQPIVGLKLARIVAVDDQLMFAPAFIRTTTMPYPSIAGARCEREDRDHPAPALDCHCGFHIVNGRRDLWRLGPTSGTVLLDVELSGMVIEHEYGCRGEKQTVLGVHLPHRCASFLCRRPIVGVARYSGRPSAPRPARWTSLRPTCERCARHHGISVADLAAGLGVEVSVDDARTPPYDTIAPEDRVAHDQPPGASFVAALDQAVAPFLTLGMVPRYGVSSRRTQRRRP
jgi:hypothetical protein